MTSFIYVTGGITSYFTSLYLLPIIAASVVRNRRGAMFVATLSALLYVGLVSIQYLPASAVVHDPWLATERLALPSHPVALYTVALNVFGFFAVALLSGSLSEGVRSAGVRLEVASSRIADLKALNQHVIDSLPSGLATADVAQRILTFNRAAETITGRSFSAVVGRPIAEVLQLSPQFLESFERELNGALSRRLEIKYLTLDEREIDIGLTATYLQTPGGRAGLLMTFQDLTHIKKLEREALMQQRLAAVGEMAAGIAHEIRNPLASMSGSIQILRQELSLSAEQEQLMDIVIRESERLNATIGSFLAYARPQRFAIAPLDVRRALTDTALLLRNSAEVHERHTDRARSAARHRSPTRPTSIRSSRSSGTSRPMGCGRCPRAGPCACRRHPIRRWASIINVQDEGIGIAPEELDHLFQPFHGRFAKGSGLGLAIVHRIVTDYGGAIEVNALSGTRHDGLGQAAGADRGGGMSMAATASSLGDLAGPSPAAHSRRRRRAIDARAAGDRAAT